MDQEVFYVFLASNASLDVNPENTISNYKVRLAKPIRFPQGTEWEVGLKDITFTHSWYTLNYEQSVKFFHIRQDDDEKISKEISKTSTTLSPGFYPSPEAVVRELQVSLEKMDWGGKIEIDRLTKTVVIKPHLITREKKLSKARYVSFLSYPLFSEELLEFLGVYSAYEKHFIEKFSMQRPKRSSIQLLAEFGTTLFSAAYGPNHNKRKDDIMDETSRTRLNPIPFVTIEDSLFKIPEHPLLNIEGTVPINLLAECHSLFVYSDIVESSRVGDSYTQLLNVIAVPSDSKFGEQVFLRYERPYYHKVSKSDFEEIEIDIKEDTGASVPFRFGRTIVTLEFRRIK